MPQSMSDYQAPKNFQVENDWYFVYEDGRGGSCKPTCLGPRTMHETMSQLTSGKSGWRDWPEGCEQSYMICKTEDDVTAVRKMIMERWTNIMDSKVKYKS